MSKLSLSFGASVPYQPPVWLANSAIPTQFIPKEKLLLGRFPTPTHAFCIPGTENLGLDIHIKRDDLSSFDLSGNKVRKLEFLLAEAKNSEQNYDCVITVGGLQSNHARATAVAARQVGLDPFLILRKANCKEGSTDEAEVGLTGNLLFDRMVGADIRLITPANYAIHGSHRVCEQLAQELRDQGRRPYVIPLGGSNALGAFGYLECVQEIISAGVQYDHIVFGCGSGGTAAGLALGVKLAGLPTQVHAVGVCDSPDYFYVHIEETARDLGIDISALGPVREWLHIHHGEGLGYARSTSEELSYLIKVAQSTGIILDPVYSGKGLYHFVHKVLRADPTATGGNAAGDAQHPSKLFVAGQKVLYIHTGGTVGLYDKEEQMLPLLPAGMISRMKVYPPVK